MNIDLGTRRGLLVACVSLAVLFTVAFLKGRADT
jgi:hypothetical protein